VGNMMPQMSRESVDTEIRWLYIIDGIDFPTKEVLLSFNDNSLEKLSDGYYFYRIGNTKFDVSKEEAIAIARKHAKSISWTAEGEEEKKFLILPGPMETRLWLQPKDPLELVYYWYVTLILNKVCSGNMEGIELGIWTDPGVVSGAKTISVG